MSTRRADGGERIIVLDAGDCDGRRRRLPRTEKRSRHQDAERGVNRAEHCRTRTPHRHHAAVCTVQREPVTLVR